MKNLLSKKKGFTLIELLVVIGIVMLLSFMAINGYIDYRKNALLNLAGDDLISQINQQKTQTIYGKTEDIQDSAKCYGVHFDDTGGVLAFSQDFYSTKVFKNDDWEFVGCGDLNIENSESVFLDEMIEILALELNEEELSGDFSIRYFPIKGDAEIFGSEEIASDNELEITLQYGDLTDYQKTFKYNF